MSKTNTHSVVKFVILILILSMTSITSLARPSKIKGTPELIVAGDSWANFLCNDRGYQKMFDERKIKSLKENSDCKKTSKNGLEAGEWIQSEQHQKLLQKIQPGSNIKFVHLSIGGNDLIARWKVEMTSQQESDLFERNYGYIIAIIESLIQKNGDIKVILSGYDFPRFTPDHPISEFRRALENMGNPTPQELNSGLIRYHQYLARRLMSHGEYQKRIFAIHHLGMQHYYDGIEDAGIGPGRTLHPDEISSLAQPETTGGELQFMSNKKSMKKWILGIYDAFHLGEKGNKRLADHIYQNIIRFQ